VNRFTSSRPKLHSNTLSEATLRLSLGISLCVSVRHMPLAQKQFNYTRQSNRSDVYKLTYACLRVDLNDL